MCIERSEVNNKMIRWGSWHWHNAGYGENLGYSSDGNMHADHLATAACGGGGKVETFEDMPDDIAETDAKITQLSPEQIEVCKWLFHTDITDSMNTRIHYARQRYMAKYEKNSRYFKTVLEGLWGALRVLLDTPKISKNHPYFKKWGLQAVSHSL